MSFTSFVTGSDGVTSYISGSGFSSTPSGNPDNNFNGKIFVVKWQSIDNPNVSYGGILGGNIIQDIITTNPGFSNRQIYLPKAEIPSGLYDLMIDMPNTTGQITPPIRIRVGVAGSVATTAKAVTGTGSIPFTPQYQDVINVPQFGRATAPFGAPTGTPEFGYGSGSIIG
jgi:hypothetical protein